jgi:hypothetical protein
MLKCITQPDWSPHIGDPNLFAWIIVTAYLAATALSVAVFWRYNHWQPRATYARERIFWLMLSFVLLALAINKQLDLQNLFTEIGRCIAKIDGWNDERRAVQEAFIYLMIIGFGAWIVVLTMFLNGLCIHNHVALMGIVVLLIFVSIRAADFYHIDAVAHLGELIDRFSWIMELGGIALIAASAILFLLRPKQSSI